MINWKRMLPMHLRAVDMVMGFVGGAIVAGLIYGGMAIAQVPTLFATSIVGTEQINCLIPSTGTQTFNPQITTCTANILRNTTGYTLSAATSGTVTMTTATNNLIFTGAVGTATVNVPPSPSDGQIIAINNGTASNFSGTITVASTDSSTFVGLNATSISNLSASTGIEYQYTAASKIWYRLR